MANIVNYLAGDQQLRLGNEEYLRGFSFGTDWNYLRIGLRFSLESRGAATATSTNFIVGVNQGTANGYRSASTTDFLGVQMSGSTVAWGTGGNYFTTFWRRYLGRIGSTTTVFQNVDFTNMYGPIAPIRGFFFVDIFKNISAGNVGIFTNYSGNAATATTDQTFDFFIRSMNQDTVPSTGTWINSTFIACPYNGTYPHDSLSVSWSDTVNKILISDILVVRYA